MSLGYRFGRETFSSLLSSYFAPVPGAPNWANWKPENPLRRVAFVSVETQTETQTVLVSVEIQTGIQTAHVEVQTTPVSARPQTTLVSVETQTIEVRDDMEDRRQREKEKQVSPVYPWDHMHRTARETEEQPHTVASSWNTHREK